MAPTTPFCLWHTTLTIIDYRKDSSGATREFHILNTHGNLPPAEAFTLTALSKLGFSPDFFREYTTRATASRWTHGGSVYVFARAPARQVFLVGIESTLNEDLWADADGNMALPPGVESLNYVVQTTIDYHVDLKGSVQTSHIKGAYIHRAEAKKVAMEYLDGQRFVEYDLRQGADMAGRPWPFGGKVIVHAVSESGQTHFVTVQRVPWASGGHERIYKEHAGVEPRHA